MTIVTVGIDLAKNVFAVHGVGGILGTLLVAFLAHPSMGGAGYATGVTMGGQFITQVIGVAATIVWSAVATVIIVAITKATVGLRIGPEEIYDGLDMASHGERAYSLNN